MIGEGLHSPSHEGVDTVGTDDQPGALGPQCSSFHMPPNPRDVIVVQQDLLSGEIFARLRLIPGPGVAIAVRLCMTFHLSSPPEGPV